jgi:hypothetical protein
VKKLCEIQWLGLDWSESACTRGLRPDESPLPASVRWVRLGGLGASTPNGLSIGTANPFGPKVARRLGTEWNWVCEDNLLGGLEISQADCTIQ